MNILTMLLNKLSRVKSALNITLPLQVRAGLLGFVDSTSRRRTNGELVPPLKMRRFIGQDQDFFINRVPQLEKYCNLTPTDKVLDVGCGCGSLAISLIQYSNFKGNYEGFDIVSEFIDWLQSNVTVRYPNFHFQHADVRNSGYNPNGKGVASNYQFPYENGVFDIVFLGSVFTHMLPSDLEHYLSEISRVLKTNGKCLITYFLLTPDRRNIVDQPLRKQFKDTGKGYSVVDINIPENAVAYKQEYITKLYKKNGLKILKVEYGILQDLIAAIKQ